MSMDSPSIFYFESQAYISLPKMAEVIPTTEVEAEIDGDAQLSAEQQFKNGIRRQVKTIKTQLGIAELLNCNSFQTRNIALNANKDLHTILGNFQSKTTNDNSAEKLINAANKIRSMNFAPSSFTPDDFETTPKVDMEERKTLFARCLLTSMDPESPFGSMPCLAHHSKGLSESEKIELEAFEPNAVKGNIISSLAVIPAVVSKAVNTLFKGLLLSAMSEALTTDPYNYDTLMKEGRRALNGENIDLNQAVVKVMPNWMLSAGKTIKNWDDQLSQYDIVMQNKYRTIPGIVREGVFATAELATMAATVPVFKGTVYLAKGAVRLAGTSSRVMLGTLSSIAETSEALYLNLLRTTCAPSLQPAYAFSSRNMVRFIKNDNFFLSEMASKPSGSSISNKIGEFVKDEAGTLSLPKKKTYQIYEPAQKKATETAKEIVDIATATGAESDIYATAMNVENIMNSDLIASFGYTKKGYDPIFELVKSVLPGVRFKIEANPNARFLKGLYHVKSIGQLEHPILIVKEFFATRSPFHGFVPEIVSNYVLNNEISLTQSHFQKIISFAKYYSEGGVERGAIIYPRLSDKFVANLYKIPGQEIPASALGRSLGEINNISVGAKILRENLEGNITNLEKVAEQTFMNLKNAGLNMQFSFKNLGKLAKEARHEPGIGALSLGNAHLNNFMYQPTRPGLAIANTDLLARSMTPTGPRGLQGMDRFQMVADLTVLGESNGHSLSQIAKTVSEFHEGYNQFYKLPSAPGIDRFNEVYWLFHQLDRLLKINPKSETVQMTIKEIEKFSTSTVALK